MPPSHRSSGSSHRSSSSSHRSSSSSHRSSSSHSSSSSSHRSYSSHRSSSSYGHSSGASSAGLFGHSRGSDYAGNAGRSAASRASINPANLRSAELRSDSGVYKAAKQMVEKRIRDARPRQNQPLGYNRYVPGFVEAKMHRCKNHDYVYYPISWTNTSDNTHYEKGYYDESGKYYKSVAFLNKTTGKYESKFVCDYCGTEIKAEWERGMIPDCPNCGASLSEVITGIAYEEEQESYFMPDLTLTQQEEAVMKAQGVKKKITVLVPIIVALLFIMPCCCCFSVSFVKEFLTNIGIIQENNNYQDDYYVDENNGSQNSGTVLNASDASYYGDDINGQSKIYVEAIGRECKWIASEECYYDPNTDCYFWYNTYVDPYIWQYWYDSISEDYAEYGGGWMEYDEDEQTWYIEVSTDEWEELSSVYDTGLCWYIEE